MSSPKTSNFPLAVLLGFLWTAFIFFVGHFLYYGWHLGGLSGYSRSMQEILLTVVFCAAYSWVYLKASFNWRCYANGGFLPYGGKDENGKDKSVSWYRFWNSLLFSALSCGIILVSLYLAGLLLSSVYVYLLEGIRGAVPPPDSRSAGTLAVQIGLAGMGMELIGKTETPPR